MELKTTACLVTWGWRRVCCRMALPLGGCICHAGGWRVRMVVRYEHLTGPCPRLPKRR